GANRRVSGFCGVGCCPVLPAGSAQGTAYWATGASWRAASIACRSQVEPARLPFGAPGELGVGPVPTRARPHLEGIVPRHRLNCPSREGGATSDRGRKPVAGARVLEALLVVLVARQAPGKGSVKE